MNQFKTLGILFATVAVVACGGGSSGTPAPAPAPAGPKAGSADKYVGTWTICQIDGPSGPNAPQGSSKLTLVNTKVDATALNYTARIDSFAAPSITCGGTATLLYSEGGTVALKGTKTIGADVVDLADSNVTSDNDTTTSEPRLEKDIFFVSGNKLFMGDEAVTPDVNGYPTALYKLFGLTKQ